MGERELRALYKVRFKEKTLNKKNDVWYVLCNYFFNQWISPEDTVADVAAGYCEFINNIKAKRKYAFDLNPDVVKYAKIARGGYFQLLVLISGSMWMHVKWMCFL